LWKDMKNMEKKVGWIVQWFPISFHSFLKYFSYHFKIHTIFLPYFPYHCTIQPTFFSIFFI
jgi:hypothetical protein